MREMQRRVLSFSKHHLDLSWLEFCQAPLLVSFSPIFHLIFEARKSRNHRL